VFLGLAAAYLAFSYGIEFFTSVKIVIQELYSYALYAFEFARFMISWATGVFAFIKKYLPDFSKAPSFVPAVTQE